MMQRLTQLSLALALVTAAGCGTQTQNAVWDDSMKGLFNGGSEKVTIHTGQLTDVAGQERLMRQMGYADAVAVGTVYLKTRWDEQNQPNQVRVGFRLSEVMFDALGLDEDEDLVVTMNSSSPGFTRAADLMRDQPGTRYLLFLKKRPRGKTGHDLQWAFYRPGGEFLAEVRTMYRRLRKDT